MSNSKVDLMMVIIEPGRPGISKKKSEGDGPGPMDLEISNSNIKAIRQPIGPKLEI